MRRPLPESEKKRQKIASMKFTTKPCAICDKPTQVNTKHEGDTWCMEHAGTWKEEAK